MTAIRGVVMQALETPYGSRQVDGVIVTLAGAMVNLHPESSTEPVK